MENLNLEIITSNIFKLLDYSGVTDLRFANLLGFSEKQLRLIKKGDANFSIDNINNACDFFNAQLGRINKSEFEPENNLREKLIVKHKRNPEYYALIEGRPTIRHVIRFVLLQDSEFNSKGLGTGDIRDILLSKGWIFTSRYISTSMLRNSDLVSVVGEQIVKGKKANVYGPKPQ